MTIMVTAPEWKSSAGQPLKLSGTYDGFITNRAPTPFFDQPDGGSYLMEFDVALNLVKRGRVMRLPDVEPFPKESRNGG